MAGIESYRPPDLNNILEQHELNQLSVDVKQKIQNVFKSRTAQYEELKVKYERLSVTSEHRQLEVENQLAELQNQVERFTAENNQFKRELEETDEKLKTASEKLKSIQDAENSSLTTQLRLTRANETLESEKRDLTVLLEKRSKEIERLNEEWSGLSDKLAQANREKCEAEAKVTDFQSQIITSQFTQKRLTEEKEALQRQIDLLNKDLAEKTQQLFNVRKEQSARSLDLQSRLEEQTDENEHLQNTLEVLRKTNSEQTRKIDQYIEKLQDAHNNQVQADEQFRQELEANQKLADLYKGQATDLEGKCKELMKAVEELRGLLKEASSSYSELRHKHQSDVERLNVELMDRDNQIQNLRRELENANELIDEIKKKATTSEHVETLFPHAAATSKLVNSGMSLTQIYNEYMTASENLYLEKEETKRLNSYIDTILQEIEEKAPMIRKQREDYEQSLETIEQMNKQLDSALLESEKMRVEADQANRKYNYMKRENEKLSQQTEDLSNQVQYLVKEIEEVKSGRIVREEDISCGNISSTTSAEVISSHLVTFRDIQDLQRQNRRLLEVIRDLSEKKEEEESLAAEEKTKDLKDELERALSEMQELKSARDRQATMVESIVRQRDYYRVLLQEKEDGIGQAMEMTSSVVSTPLKSPIVRSPLKSPAADKVLEEAKSAFKQCQEEFERYRTEMKEQVRMLNEDLRAKESKISEMLRQNMKLSSQLEYGAEKNKILQGNAEGYKRELASLREKEKKLFTSVAKHEQTINTLRQDLLSTQERLSRAEAQCHHLNTEKELLKSSEQRLLLDIDNLRREKTSQSMLMANLQSIQNTLEHSEREVKARYMNQIDKLELELNAARRNLTAAQDEHKAVIQLWENETRQLRQQLEGEIKNQENVKKILQETRQQLEETKEQLKTTEANLAEAQKRPWSGTSKTASPVASPARDSLASAEEVKTLKYQITEAKREIQNLKDQLERSKQHVTEYKTMADNLQKALSEQSECTKQFEEQLKKERDEKQSALNRLTSLVETHQKQVDDLLKGLDEQHKMNGDLRKQLTHVQQELEEAVSTRDSALGREAAAREECSQQVQIASEAKDKYERELMLHAADVEALGAIKKKLEEYHTKFTTEQEIRLKAETDLEDAKNSWVEQERILKQECQRLEQRCEEFSSQNNILHQQMEKMSNDVLTIQKAVTRSGSPQKLADVSFDEDSVRSSEQLQEVIRFLRKEKEIAQSKLEIIQTECNNVKHRYERQKKELEEVKGELTEMQIRAQANVQTAAQHAELMRKVETLNILTDSNKLLREDKTRLEQLVTELETKVSTLETSIDPLQASIRDLTAEKEVLVIERDSLKNEVDRWKSRANHLIEQANRTDPDEQKKIIQERDALKLRVKNLQDESIKHSQEKAKLVSDIKSANDEQMRVRKTLQDATNAKQELNNRANTLQLELGQARNAMVMKEKEITQLKNNLTEKENELTQVKTRLTEQNTEIKGLKDEIEEKVKEGEEKTKTINQLRKIGRKYKDQAEAFSKQLEELKSKTEAEQPPQEGATPTPAEVEQQVASVKEQLTQASQERDEFKQKLETQSEECEAAKTQLTQIQQENTQLKTEVDQLKNKNAEHEQRQNQSKSVLQAAKKKISSQNEEISKLTTENTELKQKLNTTEQSTGASEEAESRMAAMKSAFENRISNLTKEVNDNAQQLKTVTSEVAEKTKLVEQLTAEKTELQEKITALQKQIDAQPKPVAPQPQTARQAANVNVERARPVDRSNAPVTESPKTANIKPMSTSPAAVRPQAPPSQAQMAGSRVIANIRPMAIAPTSISPLAVTVPTPTATVMPTTVSQHENTDSNEVTQAQLSPVMTSRPTQQVQRVTPQVEATADSSTPSGGLIVHEVPNIQEQTATQSEVEVPVTSATGDHADGQSTSAVVAPSTSSSSVTREVTPVTTVSGARDVTVVSTVREGQSLGKRTRDESESQGEEVEAKRSKVSTTQGSPIPAITVTDEHANTLPVTVEPEGQEPERESLENPPQVTAQESEVSLAPSESTATLDLIEDSQALSESQGQQNVEELQEEEEEEVVEEEDEEEEVQEEEDEGDDAIIILESDDEEGKEEDEDEEDDDEEDEEEEEMGEDEEDFNDDEMEGEYTESQLDEMRAMTEEDEDDDDVIQLDDDSNDRQMEAQGGEVPQTTQPPPSTIPSVLFGQRVPFTVERQTSINRHLAPFTLGGQTGTFEEGEDGIVPSTPTLFVPNRGDGYAEVVSSPRISNQRFTFGGLGESSLAQPELGELASQGALGGMESTSMDLSQLDEGTGRSVPSTPLRTTAPVTISEAAIASALIPQTSTASTTGETSESTPAQPEAESTEGQEEVILEGGVEQAEEELTELTEASEPEAASSQDETTEQEKESASAPKDEEPSTSQEKTESSEKPKIQPIVWEGSTPSTSQQPRTRPISIRGTAPRGQLQSRGPRGGPYQRGRGQMQRGRGGNRGNRGGVYRSPNMY